MQQAEKARTRQTANAGKVVSVKAAEAGKMMNRLEEYEKDVTP